jgi:hypothetical protein
VTIAGLSRACYGLCTLLGRQEKSAEVATELRGSPSPVRPAPVRPAPPAEAAAQPRRLESGSASGANRDVGGRRDVVRAILVLYCSGDTHQTCLDFRDTSWRASTDREASFAPTHAALPVAPPNTPGARF